MRRSIRVAASAAALALASCTPDASGDQTGSATIAVDPTPLYTVGRADGDGPDVFGRIRDVAFTEGGELVVLDDLARRVVVFDTTGRHRATIGRAGEGPGELRQPLAVAPTSGGDVVVYDRAANAVHVFDAEGTFRRGLSVPGRDLGVDEESLHGSGADRIVFLGGESFFEEPDSMVIYGMPLHDDAAPVAVARVPNPQATPQIDGVSRTAEGGFRMTRRLQASFVPTTHLAPLPNGRVAVAGHTGYRVLVIGPDGGVEDVRSRPVTARAVSATDRRVERERRGAAMREAFGSGAGSFTAAAMSDEEIDDALEQMIFPDTMPVIRGLRSAPDGTLLVLRTDERSPDPGPMDVFDAGGTYRGTLRALALPDALGPRGLAAWVYRDELDVQRVRVARLDVPWD